MPVFTANRRRRASVTAVAAILTLLVAADARAHDGDHAPERINFDRPEIWALKYFTSATLLGGLETPRTRKPWSFSIGVEGGWLPALSETQRIVGFDGTKPEDLNKAPFFVRPRVTIGLPYRFSLIVAADPPVRSFGLRPKLLSLAVERPAYESANWTIGLRGYGQTGTVRSAFTCPRAVLPFAPGSAGNTYGCEAESSDTATLRFIGGEATVSHGALTRYRLSPHVGFAVNYLDVAFQVNALTFGFLDRTHYLSSGVTFSGSAGVTYPLSDRVDASIDAFYSPLMVRRGSSVVNDGLFNVRALVTYRLR